MALVTDSELAAAFHMDVLDDPDGFAQVAEATDAIVSALLTQLLTGTHDDHPQCKEGALQVAIDIYQARQSAGGQMVGIDMVVAPYRLNSASVKSKLTLFTTHLDVGVMVG